MAAPEVLLVYKKSKLALYVHEKKNPLYTRLVEEGGVVGTSLEAAHRAHTDALEHVKAACLDAGLKVRTHYRAQVTQKSTRGRLVITVGGDGTVLDASHKIFTQDDDGTTMLLGVNSDPVRSVGFLCAARADNFAAVLKKVVDGELRATPLRRVRGDIDGTPLPFPILNEVLFAHQNPAGTTRYDCSVEGPGTGHLPRKEPHKSSGMWVAGPVGSTAAIASAGGEILPLDDDRIQAVIREPYVTDPTKKPRINHVLRKDAVIKIHSRIREGRVYLDGPHKIIPVPVGSTLSLDLGAPPLPLIVTPEMIARRDVMERAR